MRSTFARESAAVPQPMPSEATAREPQNTASQLSGVEEPAMADPTSEHESIARLAYSYWLERSCPEGSPEQDWLQAEQAVQLSKLAKQVGRETDILGSSQTKAKSA
jgi:Protein of unknown function (DUF2934)